MDVTRITMARLATLKALLLENPKMTMREISEKMDISLGSVRRLRRLQRELGAPALRHPPRPPVEFPTPEERQRRARVWDDGALARLAVGR